MGRILVTDGMQSTAVNHLREAGLEVVEQAFPEDELGQQLQDFDILVVRSATRVTKMVIDCALETGRLKMIIRGGVGLDNIDVAYAMENGIKVANTPNASSASVAELTLAHMFAVSRFLHLSNVTMRQGKWEKKKYQGCELNGKTLGLVGFGRIAREVAKRADALGMKVVFTDIHVKVDSDFVSLSLEQLLAQSDFVSVHCPYTSGSCPVIDMPQLQMMKEGAFLIDCARGGVVNETALLRALDEGIIAGAGIDVFEEEPTPNDRLINHPRVSVSPHIGASTVEAQTRIGQEIVQLIMESPYNLNRQEALACR